MNLFQFCGWAYLVLVATCTLMLQGLVSKMDNWERKKAISQVANFYTAFWSKKFQQMAILAQLNN